nr:MAG TPA: hypothetical protein [Caudoviricetes sp.]
MPVFRRSCVASKYWYKTVKMNGQRSNNAYRVFFRFRP